MNDDRPFIDVVELRRISEVKMLQVAFEFRKDRPAHWLQRLCLWTLRKLGCFASTDVVRYERHEIGKRGQKFMQRLMARRNAIYGSFEMMPKRLLIGSPEYAELMEETVSNVAFSFSAEYYRGDSLNREIFGMKVEVIPHMRGMLLLH